MKKTWNECTIDVWDEKTRTWFWMATIMGKPEANQRLAKYRREEPGRMFRMTVKKVPV